MTSLFCSASTTASWTHFIAVSKSTISPLRTPREGACPTPRILTVPSGRLSPTTTQILEVPISRPTIKSLLAIYFLLSFLDWNCALDLRRWTRLRFGRRRRSGFRRRRPDWNRLHDQRLFFWVDSVVNHFNGRFGEGHRNISLDEQIHSGQFLFGIVAVDEELLEPSQLQIELVKSEADPAVVFVGNKQTIAL